ncbi:putative dienelactone hydrolase family protein [Eutypa lata UCREL1]|uniref:Putative dienelactone hydrolase family protein n=1 Tax=Eutypa lata (strain UCR-EL1) TaxID=1287681 RepID=M7SM42_EUTLA|nr:putative dienelactone hydrolase family protein [Eutypa lata UCREL1]
MSCPDCFRGAVHDGKPTGTLTRLHGFDVYVAEPASGQSPKGIIVLISDAFGWDFVNIRLMADNFARKKDYRIYVPDFMNGKSAPLYIIEKMKALEGKTWWDTFAKPIHGFWLFYGLITWLIPNRVSRRFPAVKAFFEAVRRNEGAHLPIGTAGYCWGGHHVVNLASGYKADGKPLIDAAFTAHPSMLTFYDDIEKIRIPTSFAVPTTDNQMSLEQAEGTRKIIEAKPEGQKGEMRIYEGYTHGFATRLDLGKSDPEGPEEAEDQALAWFEKHFEGVAY